MLNPRSSMRPPCTCGLRTLSRSVRRSIHSFAAAAGSTLATTAPRRPTRLRRTTNHDAQWIARRTIFGMGEIIGSEQPLLLLIAQGADASNAVFWRIEVIRNLAESRKLLEEARQDVKDMRERAQLPRMHTFSKLPGFFERKREIIAIERALSGIPAFNVLFGASSVGKTALCRQVLTQPHFHVLHFDLRIAGFADLSSLYFSLASQMEQYFVELSKKLPGYEDFEKESYAFKHDRIAIQKRLENGGEVKTSDVAHSLELFQSALLKYWSFEPTKSKDKEEVHTEESNEKTNQKRAINVAETKQESAPAKVQAKARTLAEEDIEGKSEATSQNEEDVVPVKKVVPVIFFDEAHRLPLLIKDRKAMKCILDAMLVLTKQDRLIHVIHATSDPFYMHWLRQLNIMQHCKIMSIGDASRTETAAYFKQHLLPDVPDELKAGLDFDYLFEIFGGKLAHLSDYVADYVNADGKLPAKQSSHYAQAHALLNLQLIHASPSLSSPEDDDADGRPTGFAIYSPLRPENSSSDDAAQAPANEFTPQALLTVCQRLLAEKALPYFPLCRELGARVVDGLVKARILELRWVEAVTPEYDVDQSVKETGPLLLPTTPVIRAAMQQVVEEWKDYATPEQDTIPQQQQ